MARRRAAGRPRRGAARLEHTVVDPLGRLPPHPPPGAWLLRPRRGRCHGVGHRAAKGIAGRAVVCEVAGFRAAAGRPLDQAAADGIAPDDVTGALAAQGVELETGDILLLHTGWLAWYRSLGEDARRSLAGKGGFAAPGLTASEATVRLLWDLHVAAVAADNPAVERWPPASDLDDDERAELRADPSLVAERFAFAHLHLLPLLGLPVGELFQLDALAAACRADGRWACLLVSAPLNLAGGVASPANAVAIR
ncbi:MAG: cyclase family protein [Gaiellaceae bacterium]